MRRFLGMVCGCVLACSSVVFGERPRWGPEGYVSLRWQGESISEYDNGGTSAEATIESAVGAGVGIGFCLNPFINLNLVVGGSGANLSQSVDFGSGPETVNYSKEATAHFFGGLEIYPFDAPLTPLIGGGVGAMTVSAERGSTEIRETNFAYNFTGGLRWDFADHWFTKVQYRIIFFELEEFDSTDPMHTVELSIGYRF